MVKVKMEQSSLPTWHVDTQGTGHYYNNARNVMLAKIWILALRMCTANSVCRPQRRAVMVGVE